MLRVRQGVFSEADLVIEVIVENMNVKQQLLDKVDKVAKNACLLNAAYPLPKSVPNSSSKIKQVLVSCHVDSRCFR